jgi:Chaperone of endosialidase
VPLNFPNSPGIGSVYTDATSGFSYEWDGTLWKSYSAASSSNIKILDDISGSFNGSTQTFTLTSGGISFVPASAQSLIITLGGVTQEPGIDYTVSATNITFTTAPDALLSFSGISLGPAVPLTYANDGNIYIRNTYTGAGTTGPFSFPEGYTVGYLDVYRNGVRLRSGSDFVGTSGTNFFLTDAAAVNDEIEAIGYKVSSLVQANSNLDNLNVTGITTTGRLQVTTNANIVGIVTASSFVGNLTGTASTASFATTSFGLSGSPNITIGNLTGVAATFTGNVSIAGTLTYEDVTNVDSVGLVTARTGVKVTAGGVDITAGGLNVTAGVSTFAGITTVTGETLFVKQLNVSGVVTATDFNSLSDVNYKENISTVPDALSKVEQLRGVKFDWKESGLPSYGVIAQELKEVLPELVHGDDPKTVNYNGIIGVLIEAIKELKAEVEDFKKKDS